MTKYYSRQIPQVETPLKNFFISTMAQVYPEDRGTNYAIRDGRKAGQLVAEAIRNEQWAAANRRKPVAVLKRI